MKKLFSTVCISLCLLFSSAAATAVQADDGDGHEPGYVCIETVATACPPNDALPPQQQQQQQSETSELNKPEAIDTTLILQELVNALLP